MNSLLTSRFLEFRRRQAPAAALPPEPKDYAVEGFISKEETVLDRMGRLVEAIARGERLSSNNDLFFKSHRRLRNAIGQFQITGRGRQSRQQDEENYRRLMCRTAPVYRG